VWQGPTWSTIEADGAPKLSHYGAKRAFAPLLLSTVLGPDGTLQAHLTSEFPDAVRGDLLVELIRYADVPAKPAAVDRAAGVLAAPLASAQVWAGALSALLARGRTDANHSMVRLTFTHTGGEVRSYRMLSEPKHADLPKVALTASDLKQTAPNRARLTLGGNGTAVHATVESMKVVGAFDDSAFMLLAGEQRVLEFTGRAPFSLDDFGAGLRVRSLRDSYV
jgi:hypothetical protein